MQYLPRLVDAELDTQLAVAGAVLLRGPKACGKTETGRAKAASEVLIDTDPATTTAMAADPAFLLRGATPRLVDEWQAQPLLWNAVRHEVDRRRAKGQFILTGSSTPDDAATAGLHSGVGRFGVVAMRTMSWFERGWSTGEVSLTDLLAGATPRSDDVPADLPAIAERLVVGGWPGNLGLRPEQALVANQNYFDLLVEGDMRRVDSTRRDPARVRRVLQSLARNVSTEVENTTIGADAGGDAGPLAKETVADYLAALERLMVTENLPAWNTHVRSSARLRKAPKRHFTDPSVCAMALGLSAEHLLNDLNYLGLLFESQVIHDLRVYAQSAGGRVSHYRDSNGAEIDAVCEFRDGSWAAVEVKLGFGAVPEAAAALLRIADTVDQRKVGPPRALIVVTGAGFAHRRPDGVHVVPLGALRA